VRKAQRELRLGVGKASDATNPNASLQLSDRVGTRVGSTAYSVSANAMAIRYDREAPVEETQTMPDGRSVLLRRTAQRDRDSPYNLSIAPRLTWAGEEGNTLSGRRSPTTTTTTIVAMASPAPCWARRRNTISATRPAAAATRCCART
jgi:hypothetical protein